MIWYCSNLFGSGFAERWLTFSDCIADQFSSHSVFLPMGIEFCIADFPLSLCYNLMHGFAWNEASLISKTWCKPIKFILAKDFVITFLISKHQPLQEKWRSMFIFSLPRGLIPSSTLVLLGGIHINFKAKLIPEPLSKTKQLHSISLQNSLYHSIIFSLFPFVPIPSTQHLLLLLSSYSQLQVYYNYLFSLALFACNWKQLITIRLWLNWDL